MTPLVPRRDDLSALSGYHSIQVETEVRLNTNESPVGPPPGWYEELNAALGAMAFNRYPDRDAVELRSALAASHGVALEQVFCANGSNEVLQCLMTAYGGPGRKALVFEPTYALHSHIARLCGTEVIERQRDDRFAIDVDDARSTIATHQPTITFLCSPNNPTGLIESEATTAAMLAAVPGLLIVDEAYGQFSRWSALEHLVKQTPLGSGDLRRLVILRTFSKTWAMAGARLGYLIADPEVVEACQAVVLPYHLSTFTQTAGLLALKYQHEMEARVAAINEERGRLMAALGALDAEVWPSDANFILFRPQQRFGAEVWQELVERSILIRDWSSWPGLEGCLRVTVGTPEENDRFLDALKEILT